MTDSEKNDSEVREWFRANGWEPSAESWYDEEGIEAWRWTHPVHPVEFAEMGDWSDEPVVTDEMREYMERHQ